MKKSSFNHYNLTQSSRKLFNINSFKGVDYSTQKFLINDGHAIDLKNFIFKNGVVQKRNGYEQVFAIKPFEYLEANFDDPSTYNNKPLINGDESNGTSIINGIWRFKAEDNNYHIIAHIGNLIYEIIDIDNKYIDFKPITFGIGTDENGEQKYICFRFNNFKSQAFVGGNKLWFLGGNKYMCLRILPTGETSYTVDFFAVEDSYLVPVPTTTMSITYKDSKVAQRMSLDEINLLTQWRKNKLISGTYIDDGVSIRTSRFWDYELDTNINCKKESDLNNIEIEVNGLKLEVENGN